jgi:3-oxoadipate enol-lactonase
VPEWITIADAPAGAGASGRVRVDRRDAQRDEARAPIVLIGGMTQTLASWGAQIRPLAERRIAIAYEARGQGTTELSLEDCTLRQQVVDFAALHGALGLDGPVDLCGFSFGGRLALAIAAERPDLVHRLVLTGVALDRGIIGRLIVRGWLAALATGDLEALTRVSLPDILGPAYLEANAALVEPMVRASIERNRHAGVLALMRATIDLPEGSPWGAAALAERVRAHRITALCLGGALDRLAPPAEVEALALALAGAHAIIDGVGHTVAIEAPHAWRECALAFLDQPA